MSDGVKITWAYRPDDRSKQGKTESVPADVAAMKVREGLAFYASEDRPTGVSEDSAATPSTVSAGTVVTDATGSGKSSKS